MTALTRRAWVPPACEDLVQAIAASVERRDVDALDAEIGRLVQANRRIHEHEHLRCTGQQLRHRIG